MKRAVSIEYRREKKSVYYGKCACVTCPGRAALVKCSRFCKCQKTEVCINHNDNYIIYISYHTDIYTTVGRHTVTGHQTGTLYFMCPYYRGSKYDGNSYAFTCSVSM